ncbi:ATP-grasp domain-containing protein [Streptomyces niveus]|uniref:ATP-grasp domain-containing protein n=1 Tax=Streptomyces niveus TaxID=193462 RepID=UPI00364C3CFE
MRVGVIASGARHPVLDAMAGLLAPAHHVGWIDPGRVTDPNDPLADVYLLKARTRPALALARTLEDRGAPVVNSAAATGLCQDRTAMAALAHSAGLPFPETTTFPTLGGLSDATTDLTRPLVVKSRHSRRHDLVARVDSAVRLRALAADWAQEPVVVQPFADNSGQDHKLWVIGDRVFAALRPSELATTDRGPTLSLPLGELPAGWIDLVRDVGAVFALDVYGVDIVDTGDGTPLIVDINAFPGIRDQDGAPEALAALVTATGQPNSSWSESASCSGLSPRIG